MADDQRPKTDDRRAIKSVRGTRDLLPPETALWNFVEAAVRDVFRVYNFHEIRTPIIEDLALFQRSVGEETDIVGKEMFKWEDRPRGQQALAELKTPMKEVIASGGTAEFTKSLQGQWLALRPENT